MAEIRDVLHAVWLGVHNRRFDKREDVGGPDSIYRGIQLAEEEIGKVAKAHGIDWHELRTPPRTAAMTPAEQLAILTALCGEWEAHGPHETTFGECQGVTREDVNARLVDALTDAIGRYYDAPTDPGNRHMAAWLCDDDRLVEALAIRCGPAITSSSEGECS